MKHKVISSKDLDIRCWSALRHLDSCEDCDRVQRCKLPEGRQGRINRLNIQIEVAKNNIRRWEEEKKLEEKKCPTP